MSASGPPRRVVVAGRSGSGKTTLARALGTRLDLPHTDLDGLFHGPGWTERPEFLDDVRRLVAGQRWVTEWQYGLARPLLLERADLLVWLDLPDSVVTWRVVRRTIGRGLRREVLWNGNREAPLRTFLTDRDHVVRWSWRTRHRVREAMPGIRATHPDLRVVRLRSSREVRGWLASSDVLSG